MVLMWLIWALVIFAVKQYEKTIECTVNIKDLQYLKIKECYINIYLLLTLNN